MHFWSCWCHLFLWQRAINVMQFQSIASESIDSHHLHPHDHHHYYSICGLKKTLGCCCFKVGTLLYGLIWVPLMNWENRCWKLVLGRSFRALDYGLRLLWWQRVAEQRSLRRAMKFIVGLVCLRGVWSVMQNKSFQNQWLLKKSLAAIY